MGRIIISGGKAVARKLVWLFIVGITCPLILSCGGMAAKKHSQGYTLSKREAKVMETVLQNDPHVFISQKGRSIIGHDIRSVSSAHIAREYDRDPSQAELKYAERTFRVTGKVEAVRIEDDSPPYVILEGTNFSSPHVFFDLADTEKVASLTVDETVVLVCECDGAVTTTPVFSDCQFIADFALKRVHEVKEDIRGFLQGAQPVFSETRETVIYLIAYARVLPRRSSCFSNSKFSDCNIASLLSLPLTSEDKFSSAVEKVEEELRSHGVSVP